jgi:hypothetical protein
MCRAADRAAGGVMEARDPNELLRMLLDEREIARALAGIARAMDERNWDAFRDLCAPQVGADLGTGALQGRDSIVALIRSFLDECGPTQHLLGNIVVEVLGERATSRSYVSDLHVGSAAKAHLTFSTLGEYQDRWQRTDGRWLLVHRTKLNRAHVGAFEVLGPGPVGWHDAGRSGP